MSHVAAAASPESAGSVANGPPSFLDRVKEFIAELGDLQLSLRARNAERLMTPADGTSEVAVLARSHAQRVSQQELYLAQDHALDLLERKLQDRATTSPGNDPMLGTSMANLECHIDGALSRLQYPGRARSAILLIDEDRKLSIDPLPCRTAGAECWTRVWLQRAPML